MHIPDESDHRSRVKGDRIAPHPRSIVKGKHTTDPEHMPTSHREYAEWTPERLVTWAAQTGMQDPTLADAVLDRLVHNAYKVELKGESMRKKRVTLDHKTQNVTDCPK